MLQNPSYAGEVLADKSVEFMEKVVFKKGLLESDSVRRLIVVNQFDYIQTNNFEGLPHQIGKNNDASITAALNESDMPAESNAVQKNNRLIRSSVSLPERSGQSEES